MRIERDKAIHDISYRKLDKSDRAGIEKLATELHNFHAMLEPERFTRIERYTIEGDYDISYGAFENESLVGIALGTYDTDFRTCKVAQLGDLYVSEKYRGQGIGKQLLSLFKEEALRQGAGRLKLCVMAINTNALNMYKSQGFKITTYCMEQEI